MARFFNKGSEYSASQISPILFQVSTEMTTLMPKGKNKRNMTFYTGDQQTIYKLGKFVV